MTPARLRSEETRRRSPTPSARLLSRSAPTASFTATPSRGRQPGPPRLETAGCFPVLDGTVSWLNTPGNEPCSRGIAPARSPRSTSSHAPSSTAGARCPVSRSCAGPPASHGAPHSRGSAGVWLVTLARCRAIDRVRSSQSSRDWERRDRHIMCDAANKKLAFEGLASVLTNVSACGAIVRPAAVSQAFVPRLGESRTAPVMVKKNGECFFSCCMENSGNSCPAIRPIRCGAHLDSAFRGHLQHEESGPMLDGRSWRVR